MKLARCRPIAVLLLALHLGACVTWRPTTVAPRQVIEEEQPSRVRVTTLDGERLALRTPVLRGDSLTSGARGAAATTVAISDIRGIEVQQISAGRTFGLIVLLAVGAVVATYAYVCSQLCGSG